MFIEIKWNKHLHDHVVSENGTFYIPEIMLIKIIHLQIMFFW